MPNAGTKISKIKELEHQLEHIEDNEQKLHALHELAEVYIGRRATFEPLGYW